jgi:hypothetical protein
VHNTGECFDRPDRARGRRGRRGRGGDWANGRGGDGFSEANVAQLLGAIKAAFTLDYSNVSVTPRDEYTPSHRVRHTLYTPSNRAKHTDASRAIDNGAAGVFLSQADTLTSSPQAAQAACA